MGLRRSGCSKLGQEGEAKEGKPERSDAAYDESSYRKSFRLAEATYEAKNSAQRRYAPAGKKANEGDDESRNAESVGGRRSGLHIDHL